MSMWTHAQCSYCWYKANPTRKPVQMPKGTTERCCFCGAFTAAGIFVRADGLLIRCKGKCQ